MDPQLIAQITFVHFLERIERYTVIINGFMALMREVKRARATEMEIARESFMYISKNWHKGRIRHWDNILYSLDEMIDRMLESVSEDFDGNDDDNGLQHLWNNNPEWAPVALQERASWQALRQAYIDSINAEVEPWIMTDNIQDRCDLYAQLSLDMIEQVQNAEDGLFQYTCGKMIRLKEKLIRAREQEANALYTPYARTCVGHIER